MKNITPTTEILGSFLAENASNEDVQMLKGDAQSYLLSRFNCDIGDTDVQFVENTDTTVNIALPYYEAVGTKTGAISEEDMSAIAGGEIGLLVSAGVLAAGAWALGGTAAAGQVAHSAQSGGDDGGGDWNPSSRGGPGRSRAMRIQSPALRYKWGLPPNPPPPPPAQESDK